MKRDILMSKRCVEIFISKNTSTFPATAGQAVVILRSQEQHRSFASDFVDGKRIIGAIPPKFNSSLLKKGTISKGKSRTVSINIFQVRSVKFRWGVKLKVFLVLRFGIGCIPFPLSNKNLLIFLFEGP